MFLTLSLLFAAALHTPEEEITLERIMSEPSWMGRSPERPAWADDGQSVFFRQDRPGERAFDWVQIDLAGTELARVPEEEARSLGLPRGTFSRDRTRKLFELDGDLFLKSLGTDEVRRLTLTDVDEGAPRFLADEQRISFRRGGEVFVRDLADGFETQPARLIAEDDPDEAKKDEDEGFLSEQQERLFEHLREEEQRRTAREVRRKEARESAKGLAPRPFYLGAKVALHGSYLSPDTRHLLAVVADGKRERGKADSMPNYVTDSGYVESRNVRSKVGTYSTPTERVSLFDLETHEEYAVDLGTLPGITDRPLAEIEAGAAAFLAALVGPESTVTEAANTSETGTAATETAATETAATETAETETEATETEATEPEAEEPEEPKPRSVSVFGVDWNPDGVRVTFSVDSQDNKDSWIVALDPGTRELTVVDHLHDPAWINGRFRRKGWIPGRAALWFLSEASGYSHVYVHDFERGETRQLTEGAFEVSSVSASHDGTCLYVHTNREHPGALGLFRLDLEDGRLEAITRLPGRNRAWLSPDESLVLIEHTEVLSPPDLWVQENRPGAEARRLTHTVSTEFASMPWVAPEVLPVPARHGRPVWSRLYLPPGDASPAPEAGRPAVLFVHGAGYLQNAHLGWSSYFREFMFHSLLAQRGFVVLDMDYRASAGYGRDWRTAIYRDMGAPELEDLADGVEWLVREHGVDRARVGVYGGSYGGFLTLMALFKEPELFACGAALRPVTDWAHYNHGYTANILNTPESDPEAYFRSSPIEFAAGLVNPLLICHGMQDDNVFFQDTVRLAQKLIELEKENFEVALYPIEPHAFREPSSWLDEYRRILALFERHLKDS